MKTAEFDTNRGRKSGEVTKENPITVWVVCSGVQIKRHRQHHNVVIKK